jgi:4-hydroxythreonine-4-phosphate dehydrogenase
MKPLALTMGEPAGIGGEITLMAWLARDAEGLPPFFAVDDPARLEAVAAAIGVHVPVQPIAGAEDTAATFAHALPVLAIGPAVGAIPGKPNADHGGTVVESIERAAALALDGAAAGIVTNPIHKATLAAAGFPYPGHTEYLAARTNASAAMMLTCPGLRVVPVTVHLGLAAAIAALSSEAIVGCAKTAARALMDDFGIAAPRLAVAALNPHGGEGGTMGREEIEVIAPAIVRLKAVGLAVAGPAPADTLFHAAARERFDAAICMYHDQALIPLKAIDFARGVNVTLGLPLVRTSPDHGTALDLAGTGTASAASLIAAIKLAGEIAERRAHAEPQRRRA